MKWLLVGFTRKEFRKGDYNLPDDFVTLDRGDFGPFRKGDIDFKYDAFDVQTWRHLFTIFGPSSFDVIFTDGGMFGVKRVDEIIEIKRKLLRPNGHIINYMSSIGEKITCPFGRPLQFYLIHKSEYTIRNHERANAVQDDSVRGKLFKKMNMII